MDAKAVIQQALAKGIALYCEGDKLKFKANKGAMTSPLLALIKQHKSDILSLLTSAEAVDIAIERPAIEKRGQTLAPLSFSQQRLWFIDKLEGGSAQYNMPVAMAVESDFDVNCAQIAINRIIERHQILRTVYEDTPQGPVQRVLENVEFTLTEFDIRDLDKAAQQARAQQLMHQDAHKIFDLTRDLMVRGAYIRLADEENGEHGILLFNMHHIASDGWSRGLLAQEFKRHYEAVKDKQLDCLPPLPIQYNDYAHWQRQWLQGDVLDKQLDFWQQYLSDAPMTHQLPMDRERSDLPRQGAIVNRLLDKGLSTRIMGLTQTTQTTLFMLMQAALAVHLGRLSAQTDVVLGGPTAGRVDRQLNDLIGLFLNTQVYRTRFDDNPGFKTLLARVREDHLTCAKYNEVPFEAIVESINPTRSLEQTPIFQILINLNNTNNEAADVQGVSGRAQVDNDDNVPENKYDITLYIQQNQVQDEVSIRFAWVYDTRLFDHQTIEHFAEQFDHFLAQCTAQPDSPVLSLPWLNQAQWLAPKATKVTAQGNQLMALFEAQVEHQPTAIALEFESSKWTYRQLNNEVNQMAHYLADAYAIAPGDKVVVFSSRNALRIQGILAVLKLGGCYVPLSQELPQGRISYMLENGAPKLILTDQMTLDNHRSLIGDDRCVIIDSASFSEKVTEYSSDNPLIDGITATTGAHVIYTSGSTGLPKGVLGSYGSTFNRVQWMLDALPFDADESMVHVTSMAFIRGVWELLTPLCGGARLVLCPRDIVRRTDELWSFLVNKQITRMVTAPSLMKALLDIAKQPQHSGPLALKHWFISGEPLPMGSARSVLEHLPEIKLYNLYGSTEVMSDVLWSQVNATDQGLYAPVGEAIDGAGVAVMADNGQLMPDGLVGELVVYGAAVSEGYLANEQQNKASFIDTVMGRTYRTGDLGRVERDGRLVCLGRRDHQLKIRGYRVELGEIEALLEAFEGIKNAIVVAQGSKESPVLVAFLVLHDGIILSDSIADIKGVLRDKLPEYMMPNHFEALESIPLRANGKVDKGALPKVSLTSERPYLAPQTDTEKALIDIWQQMLELDQDISRDAGFFELGGHSLLATRLTSSIASKFNKTISVKTIFKYPQLQALAQHIDGLGDSSLKQIECADAQQLTPLSFAQQRFWFIDKLEGGSAQFNMPAAMALDGELNIEALNMAVTAIIERHHILRTTYSESQGQGRAQVQPSQPYVVSINDISDLDEQAQKQTVARLTAEEAASVFDLTKDLMLRVKVLKCSQSNNVLMVTMHHIASDGWSLGILVNEFLALYQAFGKGLANPLPPLSIQYGDYARWQREYLQGAVLETQLEYWKDRLNGIPQVHGLPLDKPRPAHQKFSGRIYHSSLGPSVLTSLEQLALDHQASLYMVLQSAFALLLGRFSNEHDIVIGTPIAGRINQQVESLIGCFVNTLVMRTQLDEGQSFVELLSHNRQHILDAYEHQDISFEYLVDELKPTRSLSYAPLCQVMFALHNIDNVNEAQEVELASRRIQSEEVQFGVDLNLAVQQSANGLSLTWTFADSLFDRQSIERLADAYSCLLNAIVQNPEQNILRLPLVSQSQQALIDSWSISDEPYAKDLCVHQLVERQAAMRPLEQAVIFEDDYLSYQELNEQANQLAHYLVENKGLAIGDSVGICVERSLEMIIGLLAIAKAGGVYVPLDPSLPEERVAWLIEDAKTNLVLVQQATLVQQPVLSTMTSVPLDETFRKLMLRNCGVDNLDLHQLNVDDLAYVLYTSGSTGTPKGVMVEHKSITRLVDNNHFVPLDNQSRVLQAAPVAFDAATFEIWAPLANGGQLVMYPENQIDLAQLNQQLVEHQVNTLWLTAGLFEQWSHQLPDNSAIKYVLAGGDVLNPKAVKRVMTGINGVKVINGYGPTENTTFTSCFTVPDDWPENQPLPLGRVINGTQVMVLNSQMQPVPIGVVGELYVSGDGVARGYLNLAEFSGQSFISNPFDVDARLYKTGDLVRWQAHGNLIFSGRNDTQVKLRGFRIELDEIKMALERHQDVDDALVLIHEDDVGKRIVAYVVSTLEQTESLVEQLLAELGDCLPEYMVPAAIMVMPEFELTSNGKVNRSALIEPVFGSLDNYVEPRNETEATLVQIWQDLLKVERIGIEDNFFAIGGDSILSIQIVARANQAGLSLSTRQLFECQTIAKLALVCGQSKNTDTPQEACEGEQQLLPIQRYFFDQKGDDQHHFNQSVLLQAPDDFSPQFLDVLVTALYHRHDALRLRFELKEANWQGRFVTFSESMLAQSVVIEDLPVDQQQQSKFITERCNYHQRSLDLTHGPLLKAVYFPANDSNQSQGRFLLVVHHIVVDGVSWRILLKDIEQAYLQFTQGKDVLLAAKTSSYQQWGAALADWAQHSDRQQEYDYWLSQYQMNAPLPSTDMLPEGGPTVASTERIKIQFDEQQTQNLLNRCPSVYRTQVNELLLAGVYLAFRRHFAVDALRLSLEGHGREDLFEQLDTTQTVGWFTSIFPLTLQSDSTLVDTVIKRVKEQIRALPQNGIGYGALCRDPELDRQSKAEPASMLFNYLGQFDGTMSKDSQFFMASESLGDTVSPNRLRTHQLGLTGSVLGGILQITLDYSNLQYLQQTMEAFAQAIKVSLNEVIDHCIAIGQGDFTPSDFPLAKVDSDELDLWQSQYPDLLRLYPATAMQQGMYFHGQMDNSAYVTQVYPTFRGRLDVDKFHQAWQQVTDHHDILRTAFVQGKQQLHQLVVAKADLSWQVIDLRHLNETEQQAKFEQVRQADQQKGFDLQQPPLHRLTLFRLDDDRNLMLWTFHHMLLDGWCVPLVYKDVMLAYQGIFDDNGVVLGEPPLYEDYMRWLDGRDIEAAQAYWAEYLEDITGKTPLMIDSMPKDQHQGPQQQSVAFDVLDSQQLDNFAKDHHTTINTLLQLAWGYLLHRYSGEDKVVFGTTISGRPAEVDGIESMVGLFINTVPVKVDFSQSLSVGVMLNQLHRAFQASQDNGYISLPMIHKQTAVPAGVELFDSLMVFENYPIDAAMESGVDPKGDEATETFAIESKQTQQQTNYKLSLIAAFSDRLILKCDYLAEHFSHTVVDRMLVHLKNILMALTECSDIGSIDYLSETDKTELAQMQLTDVSASRQYHQSIDQLVAEQATENPQKIALVMGSESMTYLQLDQKAAQLASVLRKQGVQKEQAIAVCLPRSFNQIVAILAVLKAGCCYVPLDAEYPKARLLFMLQQSGATKLLCDSAGAELFADAQLECVDINALELGQIDDTSQQSDHSYNSLAYIMYTSGSTGEPKGVMVEHQSVVRLVQDNHFVPLNTDTVMLQGASFAFDAATFEIWGALANGGTLVLYPQALMDLSVLNEQLQQHKVNTAWLTAGLFEQFSYGEIQNLTELRHLLAGGDVISPAAVKRTYDALPEVTVINGYGPTENTTFSACFSVPRDFDEELPILLGRAIDGTQIRVLDDAMRPVPVGLCGTLYVGGAGVARGYYNQQALTDTVFLHDVGGMKGRVYNTGDRVSFTADGHLRFVGRRDNQVKIRGFRIEPGEIEHVLSTLDGVDSAVVKVLEDEQGNKRLCGYIKPIDGANASLQADTFITAIKHQLSEHLPAHMIPVAYSTVQQWPLNANGKIDRNELAPPQLGNIDEFVAASDEVQLELAQVWSSLLGMAADEISVDANFFELGGDSIISIQAVSRAAAKGLHFSVKDLFEAPTIAQLSGRISLQTQVQAEQEQLVGELKLLPIQQHFLADETAVSHYNQAVMLASNEPLDMPVLKAVCSKLLCRHDALRLRFEKVGGQWQGDFQPFSEALVEQTVEVKKLIGADSQTIEAYANQVQRSLDIEAGRLMRVVNIQNGENGSGYLLIVVHHLAVDGVSWRILLEDINTLYQQYLSGEILTLAAKTTSYRQWSEHLQQYVSSDDVAGRSKMWLDGFDIDVVDIVGCATGDKSLSGTQSVRFSLDEQTTKTLLGSSQKVYRTQINELLLAGLLLACHRLNDAKALRLDLESHGRQSTSDAIDLSQTVGWFTSVFPLTLSVEAADDIGEVICAVKEQYRQVAEHGIEFGALKYLSDNKAFAELPSSELVFNYLGQFDQVTKQDSALVPDSQSFGQCVASERKADYPLVLNGATADGKLGFTLNYQSNIYDKPLMESLMNHFSESLSAIVRHCGEVEKGRFTPADFPLAKVSDEQLRQWQQVHVIEDLYPATGMQQGLLFHSLMEAGSYVTQTVLTFHHLNIEAFKLAWETVISRHAIFRTAFVGLMQGNAHQLVVPDGKMCWHIEDVSELDESSKLQTLQQYREEDKARGFEPDQAPLMRMSLFELGGGQQYLIWSHHHALLDGWCTSLVFAEVTECYRANLAGDTANLQTLPEYRQYAAWLAKQDDVAAKQFWQQQLASVEQSTPLPLVSASQGALSHDGVNLRQSFRLTDAETAAVTALAKSAHTTVNVIMQAAWSLVLAGYSGLDKVVFGAITSGRPAQLTGVEQMIGLFINTVPVVVDVDSRIVVVDWLKQLHRELVNREANSYLSLFDIQRASELKTALFDSLLVFENYPVDETIGVQTAQAQLDVRGVESFEGTNYGICLTATLTGVLQVNMEVKAGLLNEAAVTQVMAHLRNGINALVAGASDELGEISLLDNDEIHKQSILLNQTEQAFNDTILVHELFERQVANNPDSVALVYEQTQVTYAQLNRQANQLARYLREQGVGVDTPVGICLRRSVDMVVAIMAVLKAGGAYVPLDPDYPQARLSYMLENTSLIHVLSHHNLLSLLEDESQLNITLLDDEAHRQEVSNLAEDDLLPLANSHAKQLAYVIYTSGSTGRPKGVMVEHQALHNRVNWMQRAYQLTCDDKVLQKTPYSFDVSVWEFIWTLGYGATLVIARPDGHKEPLYLDALMRETGVTMLHFVPSMLNTYLSVVENGFGPTVRQIFCSGENLEASTASALQLKSPHVELDNLYGPTEAAIDVSFSRYQPSQQTGSVPIGKPIDNIQLLVLDQQNRLCPFGATGQLFIGGVGLARGYYNQTELTQERFVELSIGNQPPQRFYQTGDLVRYQNNGELLFVGRVDSQVKLRGLRIELGEISSVLSDCENVKAAIVKAPVIADTDRQLVAYVEANETFSGSDEQWIDELKTQLSARLPDYMVPNLFIAMENWPMTASGKVDSKALPLPAMDVPYEAAKGEIELALVNIWSGLLHKDQGDLSVTANFLDIGGHSLHAMQVVHKVQELLDCEITIKDIFTYPSIRQLAKLIENLCREDNILDPDSIDDDAEDFEELEF